MKYPSFTVRVVLLVGVIGFVLSLYFHRGMVYARAGFASLVFACLLFVGWGFTLTRNSNAIFTELSFGSKSPSLPIFIASTVFLAFSALMFWLHHNSDNDGRKIGSRPENDKMWGPQLRNIVDEQLVNAIEELRQNEVKIEDSEISSSSNGMVRLLMQRQTVLEEKLEILYEGKEDIEQPDEDLDSLLEREKAELLTYESTLKMIPVSVPLSIVMLEEMDRKDVRVLLTQSDLYLRVNRHEDAKMCNEEVLELEPRNILARGRQAYFLRADGDFAKSEKMLLEIINEKEESGDPIALDYNNYAGLLSDSHRLNESLKYSDKALVAITAGDTSVSEDMVLANRAAALQNSGKYLEAQELFFKAHNLLDSHSSKNSLIGRAKCEIGRFYLTHGSTSLAVSFLNDSIDCYEKEIAVNCLAIDEPLMLLGEIFEKEGRVSEFEEKLEARVLHFRSKKDATELVLQQGLWNFAVLYYKVGRFELGESLFIESISLYESAGTPNKHKYGNMLANLGIYYRYAATDLESAEKYLRSALAIRERFEGALHENTATTLKNLAGVLNQKGTSDHLEAKKLYLRALKIKILRSGYVDFTVAKWVRAFAWLDVHMRNFWLAKIKLSYALQIYQELGCDPFFDPHVVGVVGELNRIDDLESGAAHWPWIS